MLDKAFLLNCRISPTYFIILVDEHGKLISETGFELKFSSYSWMSKFEVRV